jgi:twitching motility protein PilT
MAMSAGGPIDALLSTLWELGGTDLLLTAGSVPLLRVDGQLRRVDGGEPLDGSDVEKLVRRVIGEELAERFVREKQVDFSFSWQEKARLRGNAFRQRGTVALSLRMIPFAIPTLADLGLPPVVESWMRLPQGFILVIGATGSGKSTTLASMLDHINTHRAAHVLTIEDPIEYVHHHKMGAVNQREVGEDTDTFADALRSALREDPDVLLVGEMRDPESIQAALTIAETGHLVFATLHANDTSQALDRIVDVFPGEHQPQIRLQLASTLAGILYQQLIPKIGGGMIAAFEVLVGTAGVRNMIREGKTRQIRNAVSTGVRDGMCTIETSLSDLVARGIVTHDDAVARSLYPKEVKAPAPTLAPPVQQGK